MKGRPSRSSRHGEEVVLRKRKYDLAELVAQMRPENQHPEQEWGAPQGDEVW